MEGGNKEENFTNNKEESMEFNQSRGNGGYRGKKVIKNLKKFNYQFLEF